MTRMNSLRKQMTRAERFAKGALDTLTINRLAIFAAQCGVDLHSVRCDGAMSPSVGSPASRNELCVQGEER
jgi:hypothetical protein